MDFLRQQLERLRQQLSVLSATQKMLVAALAALMVLTVMYWGRYAATPERVAVLDQPFPPEQAVQLVSQLERAGVAAELASDGRVMVPADKQQQAFSMVAYNRMLPSNSSAAVDKIVGQMTVWDGAAKTDRLWNEKKQVLLAQTIAAFPGVEAASVQIDPAERRSFSQPGQPRASINIRMREGDRPGKQLVLAAADTVVGAQAGLTRANVMVIVDGVSHPLPDRDMEGMGMGGEILEVKQGWERFYSGKVREVLAHIRGPMIAVSVELNTKRIEEEQSLVDPKNVIQKERETTSRTDESTLPAPTSNEAGAVPNTGVVAPVASGSGGGSTTSEETAKFEVDYGKTRRVTKSPPGDATVTSASVRVPRGHFVAMWKQLNPKATEEPAEPALAELISRELDKIRKDVMACTGLKDPQLVMVDYYVETDVAPVQAGTGMGGLGLPVLTVVGGYGKEIALGGLALAALLMVSGMVKKGAGPVPAMAVADLQEQQREMERLAGSDEVVGAAAEGVSALEAIELDEETSKTQQMVEQVTSLVKDNPDGATTLVKRWLARS
jgi:flagellar biosynthesis/type III secretory pathway M-ring protein FliF/YscJ